MELLGVKQQLKSTFDQIPDSGKTGYIWFVREHDENNPIINPKHEIYINARKYGDIVPPMVEVTYSELVTLVNDARLVPGQEYRITDYETTSVDTGTTVAGHQFDIIVTADDETTLNENVRFAQHEGDTYFNGCNLDAWEGKYSIDNNLNLLYYEWTDTTNGKGVIYYLKDEHRNECPYDFKNILFKDLNDTGVTMYTFSIVDNGVYKDSSISPINFVHDNVIKPFTFLQSLFLVQTYTQRLNRNIFFGQDNYYNTFATNSSGNTIYSSYNCTFGENCTNNVINSNSNSNNFGDNCSNNVLASYCSGNTFGNLCSNNTFGGSCQYNDFGNGFSGNTMGTYCLNNTFETGCVNNTFGSFFQTNTVFNGVSYLNFTVNYNPNYGNRLRNLHIYCGYRYNSLTAVPTGITLNASYCQSVGFQSDGTFKVKNLLDDEPDMFEITYSDLVALRNSSGLTPGMQYRITDYVTMVNSSLNDPDTGITSAGHVFDIIVTADDEITLNENVRFALHEGDTYFTNSNLDAWEGKYTIENDRTKFAWAEDSGGTGVIYYLKDEFRNECPYDFKNILYNKVTISGQNRPNVYTFFALDNNVVIDTTVMQSLGSYNVHDNVIKPLFINNIMTPNRNVFAGSNNYGNILQLNCRNNVFDTCYNCTFGESCYGNSLGVGSYNNNFSDNCYNNSFANNCYNNTLCTSVNNVVLANGGYYNFFASHCNNITGSIDIQYNTFEEHCHHLNFKDTHGYYVRVQHCIFGNGVANLNFMTNDYVNGHTFQYLQVFNGYGSAFNSMQDIPAGIATNVNYAQAVGIQSDGTFKVKNLLDDAIDMIEIEYADLVTLRNSSGLTPGMQYRITDYVTTVANVADASSAEHPFDIIVFADDESTLNENVRFALHEGDTYFSSCNIDAWEGKYSIDNDTDRFEWVDVSGGTGVIYYLKDEFNNECPYDFKNVQYYYNKIMFVSQFAVTGKFTNQRYGTQVIDGTTYYQYTTNDSGPWGTSAIYTTDSTLTTASNLYTISGETVTQITNISITNVFNGESVYTFSSGTTDNYIDTSLTKTTNIYDNVIKEYIGYEAGIQRLNFIYFLNTFCFNNYFGVKCHNNSFEKQCHSNTFGNGCCFNTFGYNCNSNNIGADATNNVFRDSTQNNIIGNNCSNNVFGEDSSFNIIGNECAYNNFNINFFVNTIENNVQHNNFPKYFHNNFVAQNVRFLDFTVNYTNTDTGTTMMNLDVFSGYNYQTLTAVPTGITLNASYCQSVGFKSDGTFEVRNLLDDLPTEVFNLKERYPQYQYYGHMGVSNAFMIIDLSDSSVSATPFSTSIDLAILCNNYTAHTYYTEYNLQVMKTGPSFEVKGNCTVFSRTGVSSTVQIDGLKWYSEIGSNKLYLTWDAENRTTGGVYIFSKCVSILGNDSGQVADKYCKLLSTAIDGSSWSKKVVAYEIGMEHINTKSVKYDLSTSSTNTVTYLDYEYRMINVTDSTSPFTLTAVSYESSFRGVSAKRILIVNSTNGALTFNVAAGQTGSQLTLRNMYGSSSISIPAGKSFEAEFTYWDANVATFKGFLET